MPQKASESHEEYRERQQTVPLTEQAGKALAHAHAKMHQDPAPDPKPNLEGRVTALEGLIQRVIDACCKHHSGLCRDLEGPKTEEAE